MTPTLLPKIDRCWTSLSVIVIVIVSTLIARFWTMTVRLDSRKLAGGVFTSACPSRDLGRVANRGKQDANPAKSPSSRSLWHFVRGCRQVACGVCFRKLFRTHTHSRPRGHVHFQPTYPQTKTPTFPREPRHANPTQTNPTPPRVTHSPYVSQSPSKKHTNPLTFPTCVPNTSGLLLWRARME